MTSHICWYTFLINWSPTCLNFGNYILLTKQKVFICYVYIPFDKIFLSVPYIYALTSAYLEELENSSKLSSTFDKTNEV